MPIVRVQIKDDTFLQIYQPIRHADADLKLYYGGRDSGKSYEIALELFEEILMAKTGHFKCILVRKTYASIRESQFDLIKSIVLRFGMQQFFRINTHPMEIEFKPTGNRFICRGCDNTSNSKSMNNPTHAWYEEGNQLTEAEYTTVSTSLRSNEVEVKEYFSFNPECDGDFKTFWLYKNWFSHTSAKSFTHINQVEVGEEMVQVKIIAIHSTYRDNIFCSKKRAAKLEALKTTSPYYYAVYCNGDWGIRENLSPFILTFDRNRHVGRCSYDQGMPIYISFDFNRNPMCATVFQFRGHSVRVLECIKYPNSTIQAMCDSIMLKYPRAVKIVCGDIAGIAQSGLVENVDLNSYWKVVKQKLNLNEGQMQYVINPIIEQNQVLVNTALSELDIVFNESTCQALFYDFSFAEIYANGKLKKGDREDIAQQCDALDTFRYFVNRYFKHLAPILPKNN